MGLQGGAGDRHEGHHEGVNPQGDQPFAHGDQRRGAVPQPGQQVGGHLAPAEHRHRRGEGLHVALQPQLRLARQDPPPHLLLHHLQVHAQAVHAGRLHAAVPGGVVRGLALGLDRQVHPGLDGGGGLGHQPGAPVVAVGGAGGEHQLAHAIETHGRFGHLGHLVRRFSHEGAAILQRLLDGAELARLAAVAEADAGLQERGGQHVPAVQQGDRAVGDAIGRGQVVEAGLGWGLHGQGRGGVTHLQPAAGGGVEPVGRAAGHGVVDGHHHGGAFDAEGAVIGRAGPAAAARVARHGRIDHPMHLQFGERSAQGAAIVLSHGAVPPAQAGARHHQRQRARGGVRAAGGRGCGRSAEPAGRGGCSGRRCPSCVCVW